ncbi:30S ribosomal protein S20 [Candidatus Phytoplasma mali]|uniref:Small ribosomal subunit protein bS20 n=1 Tax=Phytoplasma mali (strain AT) TaxID=482235 RepID=RS20_PHYMT|nr:30S ribosomal protein S20 [Candidatus Phytoplasma mali]B3R0F6.1 RecName: Full=Small ribosomal subunit protein bS20; AltName: Full=30S ribosomal protein S20 [Candidatus Phytoplasma mali AT]CAP18320.1 30S ribosomal protein S20 [Candidatus Phytoplasma mali]
MANIKQQIKRNKTNEKRRLKNVSFKSSVKTAIKKLNKAIENKNKSEALLLLNLSYKKLDKGISKKVYSKNFVSRHKSNLSKLVNNIN